MIVGHKTAITGTERNLPRQSLCFDGSIIGAACLRRYPDRSTVMLSSIGAPGALDAPVKIIAMNDVTVAFKGSVTRSVVVSSAFSVFWSPYDRDVGRLRAAKRSVIPTAKRITECD